MSVEAFKTLFGKRDFPYTQEKIESLTKKRDERTDLFFDLLCIDLLGLRPSIVKELYPPSTFESFHQLYLRILDVEKDSLKKNCIIYYLLLDFEIDTNITNQDTNNIADEYALKYLPDRFTIAMDGFHSLDMGDIETAFEKLSSPHVEVHYIDRVIKLFTEYDPFMAIQFVENTTTPLDSQEPLSLYFSALTRASLYGALLFERSCSQDTRPHLVENMLETVFESKSRDSVLELSNLPLDSLELSVLKKYASSNRIASEVVAIRCSK